MAEEIDKERYDALLKISKTLTDEDVDKMIELIKKHHTAVDDIFCIGRQFPLLDSEPFSRLTIETEFMQGMIANYLGDDFWDKYQNRFDLIPKDEFNKYVLIFTRATRKSSFLKDRLDLLFKYEDDKERLRDIFLSDVNDEALRRETLRKSGINPDTGEEYDGSGDSYSS
jgi:hypothetical protein